MNIRKCLQNALRCAWRVVAAVWLVLGVAAPSDAAPFLVKDIADFNEGSDPFGLVATGGRLYFTAFHEVPPGTGGQVWRSDGGEPVFLADGEVVGALADGVLIARCEPTIGCALLRGDATGAAPLTNLLAGSFDPRISDVTVVDGVAYFLAQDSEGGALWQSDGTPDGTKLVLDFGAHPAFGLTASDGLLYFARCEEDGCALWKSDGGAVERVTIVVPGPLGEDDDHSVFDLTDVQGTLYFATCQRFGECDLWLSDGTADGTFAVAHFDPNNEPDSDDWDEPVLMAVGDRVAFYAVDDEDDKGLWATDGTSPGTVPLADVDERDPQAVVADGDRLFFRGVDENGDRELWLSDGTPEGTARVADLNPEGSSDPDDLCPGAGGVVFVACDATHGCEPWASDGTGPGTVRLADVAPGPDPSFFGDCRRGNDHRVYFAARSPGAGREMWKTDGTPGGTAQVADINPGPAGADPRGFVAIDDRVFFVACQLATGCEVWTTDGTAGSTSILADLDMTGGGSLPTGLRLAAGLVFFQASDPTAGRELWRSDGTAPGTIRLTDVRPGFESSLITDVTPVTGGVLFTAAGAPWNSDGTVAGTAPLVAPAPLGGCAPGEYTALNGAVFFRNSSTEDGCELWRTDGTAAGTARAVDVVLGPVGSSPTQLVGVGGTLFFVATDPEHGAELWKSDGTAEGTMLVKNIAEESGGGQPLSAGLGDLTAAGDLLFFTAFNYGCSCSNTELWRSDGTADGTFQVKDIYPGPSASEPALLTDVDGTLYFRACAPDTGCELWRSDGTEPGTSLVKDATDGPGGSVGNLVAVGRTLFFSVHGELGVDTLWTSDGTPGGTRPVTTLPMGGDGSTPRGFTDAGGKLLYVVSDLQKGSELWTSDGTVEGTRRLTDIWAGAPSSISELSTAVLNATVFFQATEPEHGAELWGMPLCEGEPTCVTTTTTTTVATTTTTVPPATTTTTIAGSTTTTIIGSTTTTIAESTTTTTVAGTTTTSTVVGSTTTTITESTTTTTVDGTTTTTVVGSTTTTAPPVTTTTTLPAPECTLDADCRTNDPCADARCVSGECTTSSTPTLTHASCELSVLAGATTCAAGQSDRLDRSLRKKVTAAAHLVDAANVAPKPKKAARLLKRARAGLKAVQRRVGKSKKLSAECRTSLSGALGEQRQTLTDLTPKAP